MSSAVILVGVADCAVSADTGAVLATCALGSCVAVAVWDPVATVGGLLHFMLPDSSLGTIRGRDNRFVYADTGIPEMVRRCVALGAEPQRMITRAAGGAQVLNDTAGFQVGSRNAAGLYAALRAAGLRLHGEALGGAVARSVRLEVGTGRLFVRIGANNGVEMHHPHLSTRPQNGPRPGTLGRERKQPWR